MHALLVVFALLAQDTVPYAKGESWLCRPGRADACAIDLTTTVVSASGGLTKETWSANPNAPIDCFYVYPTVSRDSTTHSDRIAGDEERNVIRTQFARFASVCRPYAPLYRQVTLKGLSAMMSPGGSGIALDRGQGYDDVAAAWRYYLAHDNGGRGVVLIGHSQGAMILTELMRREIDGTPVQARLVSAILLGTSIPVPRGEAVGGAFKSVPLCRRAGQMGCIITFGSYRSTVPPSSTAYFGRVAGAGMEAACTNPAALAGGRAPLHSYLTGAGKSITGTTNERHRWVSTGPAIETPFVSVPGLLSAQCVSDARGSRLELSVLADSADPRADDITGDLGRGTPAQAQWGMHLIDVHVVMGDLIEAVRRQSATYASPAATPRGAVPRTSGGRPDMNGLWQSLGSANYDIEPHEARGALAWRPGPVVPVPAPQVLAFGAVGAVPSGNGIVVGGRIPYTAAGRAKQEENQAQWLARDPEIRCYLPGVPRATYMPFPFQILQSERKFFIAYEYAGAVRDIYSKDPGPPQVDSWMGQSVGVWEGDTFVVTVSGLNADSWFDRSGNHHTEAMKVVERYTMLGPDHIQYEATIEDPQTFTQPWTIRLPLYRHVNANAVLGQFKCVEFVEELLYGQLRKNPIKP